MTQRDVSQPGPASSASRRSFVRLLGLGSLTTAAVALAACTTPAASPTAAPKPAATAVPAKPTAGAATKPAEATKPAASPAASPAAKPTEKPAAQAPSKAEAVSIKIGVPSFQFVIMPIHMAVSAGMFKDQNLNVEILQMDATQTIVKALIAKEVDAAEMDTSAQVGAIVAGAPARILGTARKNHHYMVAALNTINSLKDLEGKRLAVSTPNSAPNVILELLFKAENLNWESTQKVAVGGGANRSRALIANQVDATAFGIDEKETIATAPNVKQLLLVKDVLPKYVGGGLIMNQELIQRAGVAERYVEAIARSARYCYENKDACVNLAVEKSGRPREAAAQIWDDFVQARIWEPNLIITPEEIDYLQQVNLDLKTQDKKVPAEQIIDMSHAQRALARIGQYTVKA